MKFGRVKLHTASIEHLGKNESGNESAYGRAVFWRLIEEIIGCAHMACTGHIADDHIGLAGNMGRQIARDEAGIIIKTAARPGADDHFNRLVFVEILSLCMCGQA